MLRKILLSPDPAPKGDSASSGTEDPVKTNESDQADPKPAPPPAAKVVVESGKSERELQLEADLQRERDERKKDQIKLSETQDENQRLKQVPQEKKPAKAKKSSGPISSFFGWEGED